MKNIVELITDQLTEVSRNQTIGDNINIVFKEDAPIFINDKIQSELKLSGVYDTYATPNSPERKADMLVFEHFVDDVDSIYILDDGSIEVDGIYEDLMCTDFVIRIGNICTITVIDDSHELVLNLIKNKMRTKRWLHAENVVFLMLIGETL